MSAHFSWHDGAAEQVGSDALYPVKCPGGGITTLLILQEQRGQVRLPAPEEDEKQSVQCLQTGSAFEGIHLHVGASLLFCVWTISFSVALCYRASRPPLREGVLTQVSGLRLDSSVPLASKGPNTGNAAQEGPGFASRPRSPGLGSNPRRPYGTPERQSAFFFATRLLWRES